jgi:GT2 family glycosyltransferase
LPREEMLEPTLRPPVQATEPQSGRADLSVVLVCWNNRTYLERCLESLYSASMRRRFQVIVVDNGSSDGGQEMVRQKFPDVRIIQNDRNVGLSRASNQGIEATSASYVLLLNDDTLVDGDSLDAMADFLDAHPEAAAVGGRLLNPDGTVQACHNAFPTLRGQFMVASGLGAFLRPGYPAVMRDDAVREVDWMGSACLLLRRQALVHVGLLDEEYFIYGDEADLQYRFRDAGWRSYYLPSAMTIHYGGRSMNRWSRRKMVYRGHLLFFRKNYGHVRTSMLRLMLGGLSLGKIAVWTAALSLPCWRERARNEVRSNVDVIKLCWASG